MENNHSSVFLNTTKINQKYNAYKLNYPGKLFPKDEWFKYDFNISASDNLNNLALTALENPLLAYYCYKPIFLDLIARWIQSPGAFEQEYNKYKKENNKVKGSIILQVLSKLLHLCDECISLFELFLQRQDICNAMVEAQPGTLELEQILLSFYRLLQYDTDKFKRYINPNVLYKMVKSKGEAQENEQNEQHVSGATLQVSKYLIVQILALYLLASESSKNKMLHEYTNANTELDSFYEGETVNYYYLPLLEAKRIANFKNLPTIEEEEEEEEKEKEKIEKVENNGELETKVSDFNNEASSTSNLIEIDASALTTNFITSICGVLVPRLISDLIPNVLLSSQFVPTSHAVSVLRSIAKQLQKSHPVMLVGAAGSGKSFFIEKLAHDMCYTDSIVKIHLGEQTDAKLLLGTYASGEKPGSFRWNKGVLTTAVETGKWVLIEDIDQAPTEILSVLLMLLEKRQLNIPSRGETVFAKNGFQLFATIRNSAGHGSTKDRSVIPDMIGSRFWKIIELAAPSDEELRVILFAKYPLLSNLLDSFLKCYSAVLDFYSQRSFISLSKGQSIRAISLKDLMKFCSRCSRLLEQRGVRDSNEPLDSSIYDEIFAEAIACFGSTIAEPRALTLLINYVGEQLGVPSSRVNQYLLKIKPRFLNDINTLRVGRATVQKSTGQQLLSSRGNSSSVSSFARTNHALHLMEEVGVAISMAEPVLLVGETGTGKTTVVQEIAKLVGKKLTVINVSQQTESGDLLGGYKPVNVKSLAIQVQELFGSIFMATFSEKKNERFNKILTRSFNNGQWKNVLRLWQEAYKMAVAYLEKSVNKANTENSEDGAPRKKQRSHQIDPNFLLKRWHEFQDMVKEFEIRSSMSENSFIFDFVEGSLIKAIRDGDWLLLDEINLASPDTLESITDLLNEQLSQRSILLTDRGDTEPIKAHPEFRIFGCMNPSTDVGKRDLPISIRSQFTEIYVQSPDRDLEDLLSIIDKYIGRYSVGDEWVVNDVAELYMKAKVLSELNQIVDGANQRPHFSIRTLSRTLTYVSDIIPIYGLRRSLFEGFSMTFLTLLDVNSALILKPIIEKYTINRLKNAKSVMSSIPACPSSSNLGSYIQFQHYWMKRGPYEIQEQPDYILTPYVKSNLLNLVRATSGRRFPVLIQGPTSAGKTSMIRYLASITGHKFMRINNHEHTDLQEYLGTYVSDSSGKLVFQEGVLVEALRNGYWLVLDELNLAPTDVLEALNRLLDDNRELFIPETQEVIKPHPDFMLFATQNPPGLYGGRKVLSRAFRNRFLELHFDDIPQNELETILHLRCQIAPSYAKKIVDVYRELSVQRQSTRLFEQKNSFATLRDLFRWASREAVGYDQLAINGYMLLAERVRKLEEKREVQSVIEKVMKVKLDMDKFYDEFDISSVAQKGAQQVIWTKAMRRLAVLVLSSMQNNEPVLLVGETGCGKTTICQVIADAQGKKLIALNAHQNTETGDLIGSQRPARNRAALQSKLRTELLEFLTSIGLENVQLLSLETQIKHFRSQKDNIPQGFEELAQSIEDTLCKSAVLFQWNDGPLVEAMKSGDYFLLDEISLADDSVLERLNSVLEPERTILLAEKGSDDAAVTAAEAFKFFATMNPGGDYGKKELSPALRNRFTEIWVPSMEDYADVQQIVQARLKTKQLADAIVQFSEWYGLEFGGGSTNNGVISLRDILAWVEFVNSCEPKLDSLTALYHGASMVFIDALGTNNTAFLAENQSSLESAKSKCLVKLASLTGAEFESGELDGKTIVQVNKTAFQAGPFAIPIANHDNKDGNSKHTLGFSLEAPTTASNAMKVVRAMQVNKPILLEGSPGVGKTSLVSALAKATGNELVRINLSEQTDLVDLFGSDAPVEDGAAGEFVWRDAPFLRAMQRGDWVLLDEMNLASQAVLEGLNACLDHRGEAYIPELDRSFKKHADFRIFAAQNPQYQGGGRKGLPKSFVNRFSVVYVDILKAEDLHLILQHLYPQIPKEDGVKLIKFMSQIEYEVVKHKRWGHLGSPWEFNLRDSLRWLTLYTSRSINQEIGLSAFIDMIICQRFRTQEDRNRALRLFEDVFGPSTKRDNYFNITQDTVQFGDTLGVRDELFQYDNGKDLLPLQCNFKVLETALRSVAHNIPLILTGPTSSGKTSLVRYLANLLGAKLEEFSMNSEVDAMDILGGYEQSDIVRQFHSFLAELSNILNEQIITSIRDGATHAPSSIVIEAALKLIADISSSRISLEQTDALILRMELVKQFLPNEVFDSVLRFKHEMGKTTLKFEWFDGQLIQAIENGHWIVLDNANLCPPSVLDRLNSLLETNGTLLINECTNSDGEPRVVKPHPNFRLFLTVNPKYGELSRAMRNRGIEVYMALLEDRMTKFDSRVLGNLAIGENIVQKSAKPPTAIYSFDRNTNMRNLSLVFDTILSAASDVENTSIWSLLSLRSLNEFESVLQLVNLCSEFVDESNAFKQISESVALFLKLGLSSVVETLYGKVDTVSSEVVNQAVNYAQDQSLHPLVNLALVSTFSQEFPLVQSSESTLLYEVVNEVQKLAVTMSRIEMDSLNKKIDELSYLERSAAIIQGRNIKFDSKRDDTFVVLQKVVEFIFAVLSKLNFQFKTLIFAPVHNLLSIALLMIETSYQNNLAKAKVLKDLIVDWCERNEEIVDISDNSGLVVSATNNSSMVSLSSARGFAMDKVWDRFRGQYPSTLQGWTLMQALYRTMKSLDEVAKFQSYDEAPMIAALAGSIEDLYKTILRGDYEYTAIESIIAKSTSTLESLKQNVSLYQDLPQRLLSDQFTYICDVLESTGEKSNLLQFYVSSDRSLKSLIGATDEYRPYPRILSSLFDTASDKVGVNELFTSSMVTSALQRVGALPNVAVGQYQNIIKDISLLGYSVVDASPSILTSQVNVFKKVLLDWVKNVLSSLGIVEELDSKSNFGASHGLESQVHDVITKFIIPAISLANESTATSLGKAWIFFSYAMTLLYVPNTPNDPAIKEYIEWKLYANHNQFVTKLLASWQSAREVISGDEQLFLETTIQPLASALKVPERPKVYRSEESIDAIFEEWNAIVESSLDLNTIEDLLHGLSSNNNENDGDRSTASSKLALMQNNISKFVSRLNQNYPMYADLNDILIGYLYGLNFGLSLVAVEQNELSKHSLHKDWLVNTSEILKPSAVITEYAKAQDYIKTLDVNNSTAESILVYFLQLGLAHHETCDDVILGATKSLYYRWSLRKLKSDQAKQEEGNWFKYKDADENYEDDFKNMFPDYEDVVTLAAENDSNGSGSGSSAVEKFEKLYSQLAQLYISHFHLELNTLDFPLKLTKMGCDLLNILSGDDLRQGSTSASAVAALVNSMALLKNPNSDSVQNDNTSFHFYRDSNPTEVQKAAQTIQSVYLKVKYLLEEWPDHATLKSIASACREFSSFPIGLPLGRFLQKVEQIYYFIAEWQKYSSKQTSLEVQYNQLTELIVSWRKLELSTWNSLFKFEEESLGQKVGFWWFHLLEVIIIPIIEGDADKDHAVKLTAALNTFLSNMTMGEFSSRLSLLQAFRNHAKTLQNSKITVDALSNCIDFYVQFGSTIAEKLSAGRALLQKEISEVILLASWKDVNIDALKQSARKSHTALFKIVRKYRLLLSEPVQPLVETGLSLETLNKSAHVNKLHRIEQSVPIMEGAKLADISSWTQRPARLQNLNVVIHNLGIYTNKAESSSFPPFLEFSNDLHEKMEALRKETPKQLTENNKKIVAALKNQKRKLLSDTLRDVRRCGLKLSFRSDIQATQGSVTLILANSTSFNDTCLVGCDTDFFRLLDLLPRLRSSASNPAEDVPITDVDKGLAAIENLIHMLVVKRLPLNLYATEYAKLNEVYLNLLVCARMAANRQQFVPKGHRRSLLKNKQTAINETKTWLEQLVKYAKSTLNSINYFNHKANTNAFDQILVKMNELSNSNTNSAILTNEVEEAIVNYENFLVNIREVLNTWKQEHLSFAFVADVILDWMNQEFSSGISPKIEDGSISAGDETTIEDCEREFRDLSSMILVSCQKICQVSDTEISEEDDNWLLLKQEKVASFIKSSHIKSIISKLSKCLELVTSIAPLDSDMVSHLCAFTSPLVENYVKLCSIVLQKSAENYTDLAKTTYHLASALYTLATKGFCSPEPPSEQKQDQNLQDGTGLGDGEGVQNNSKDVEEDEDLLEDAQKPNDDQKDNDDGDEDDNNDAVDMEGDMAGELENLSDQSDEEGDDKDGDDQDEEELDDEIDDIDDLDPNSVDEKMWDEEAKNEKEKESDKLPENSTNDDNMEANESGAEDDEKKDLNQAGDDKENEPDKGGDNEEEEGDEEGDEEEDVGEQEDEVDNNQGDKMEDHVPESEVLDLPEDMNLDGDDDDEMDVDLDGDDAEENGLDDKLDLEDDDVQAENDDQEKENSSDVVEEQADGENESDLEDAEQENAETNDTAVDEEPREDEVAPEESEEQTDEKDEKAERGDAGEDAGAEQDTVDKDSATNQSMGESGEGAENVEENNGEDQGVLGGEAQKDKQEEKEKEENDENAVKDEAREAAKESLKELGDSLKEFHRRHQDILEAQLEDQEDVDEKAGEDMNELQHDPVSSNDKDLQALGSANQDQAQKVDDNMAIDDEDEDDNGDDKDIQNERPFNEKEQPEDQAAEGDEDNEGDDDADVGGENEANDLDGGEQAIKLEEDLSNDSEKIDPLQMDIDEELSDDDEDEEIGEHQLQKFNQESQLPPIPLEEARELWKSSELATQELASGLCEQLRLILEPTLSTKLRGDYKTGKRLNMKRIIPYIASDFKKDKIWLRRTKPSKRQYQIMIAVDDSKSMSESNSDKLAFHSIALVSKALSQLESGGLSIVRFGEDVKVVHPFDKPFNANSENGAKVFQWFDFKQSKTDIKALCKKSLKIFEAQSFENKADLWQLQIILSDGVCESHDSILQMVRKARDEKIMMVFVVIDGINLKESIMDMQQVKYEADPTTGELKLKVDKYLDSFPFEFYVVVKNINELPEMLSTILRQYFAEISSTV